MQANFTYWNKAPLNSHCVLCLYLNLKDLLSYQWTNTGYDLICLPFVRHTNYVNMKVSIIYYTTVYSKQCIFSLIHFRLICLMFFLPHHLTQNKRCALHWFNYYFSWQIALIYLKTDVCLADLSLLTCARMSVL